MLLLGHVGITMGTTKIVSELCSRGVLPWQRKGKEQTTGLAAVTVSSTSNRSLSMRVSASLKALDYRLVVIGALLPDIIDKPIGIAFFGNGRIFAHSLIFILVLLAIGVILYRWKGRTGVLVLSLCAAGHLVLDRMWGMPATLFWPFRGWAFPDVGSSAWFFSATDLVQVLTENLYAFVGEIIGGLMVLGVLILLIVNRNIGQFIRTGIIK